MKPVSLDCLPEEVLMKLFEYLPFNDLCRCSRVSQKWRHLAQSLCLKEVIVEGCWITKIPFDAALHLLLKHPLITERTQTFNLRNYQTLKFDSHELDLLRERCPHLKTLILEKCALTQTSHDSLPKTLSHLSLRLCDIRPHLLFSKTQFECKITCLDLSGSNTCFTSEDMSFLPYLSSLRCLYLESCHRVNNGGVESIFPILHQLHVLDLEGTCIDNEIIPSIFLFGSQLRKLFIGHTCIDDFAFNATDLSQIPHLETLCLRGTKFSFKGVSVFTSLLARARGTCIINSLESDEKKNHSHEMPNVKYSHIDECGDFKGCYHYLDHACPPPV